MICLRKNSNQSKYFDHNNGILKEGEIVVLRSFKYHCPNVVGTVSVLIKNQEKRIGRFVKGLTLDINCFDYAGGKPKLTEEELNNVFFDNNGFPDRCHDSCGYFTVTRDAFSTGDSPTEYDCDAVTRKTCPLWNGDE